MPVPFITHLGWKRKKMSACCGVISHSDSSTAGIVLFFPRDKLEESPIAYTVLRSHANGKPTIFQLKKGHFSKMSYFIQHKITRLHTNYSPESGLGTYWRGTLRNWNGSRRVIKVLETTVCEDQLEKMKLFHLMKERSKEDL